MTYQVPDALHLWYLGRPQSPELVGVLRLVRNSRGVSLQYAPSWLRIGFALSEDLPLTNNEHQPNEQQTAAGAVDDARPDRWGERVIRFLDKPPRLSVLEFLYFAGDERFGALGVSTQNTNYAPRAMDPLPRLKDVAQIHELVRKIQRNEPIPEDKRRLIAPGTTLGGARPKALLEIDGAPWVVKFSETGEPTDSCLLEHACMTLAARADVRVAETRAVRLVDGHAIAVRRFDRAGTGTARQRIHALSAHVALRAEGSPYGYPELAQLLRRRGPARGEARRQMHELFRRMVFNILMDNTDDHEKNHVLLMDDAQKYSLSPAFDVLPTCQGLGFQQMRVGVAQADSTIDNALSESALFGLGPTEARRHARQVAAVCDGWKDHFAAAKVSAADIDNVARFVDRDFLRHQRAELLRRR